MGACIEITRIIGQIVYVCMPVCECEEVKRECVGVQSLFAGAVCMTNKLWG